MAGGDYDGGLVLASCHEGLLKIVRDTAPAADAVDVEALEEEVKDMLAAEAERIRLAEEKARARTENAEEQDPAKAFQEGNLDTRRALYQHFACHTPTWRLRGWACALAERVAEAAMQAGTAELFRHYFLASMCAHKAMDVPKKYPAHVLKTVMKELTSRSGVGCRDQRSTKAVTLGRRGMHLIMTDLHRHNTFTGCKEWLDGFVSGSLGRIWMPQNHIVLGLRAGMRVRSILLSRPRRHVPYYERTAVRSPVVELAGLIAHKLSRVVGPPEEYCTKGAERILEALQRCRRTDGMSSLEALGRATMLI